MIGLRILCLVIGYAFGNFQTAYILGKMNGIDIREYGSGNAGTTNAIRVLGTKAGLTVFIGDMLKVAVAIFIALCMIKENAVMAGFAFGYHWSFIPTSLLLFFVPYLTTTYVSLGSLMVYGGTFIQMIIEGQLGLFKGVSQANLIEMYLIQFFLTFMAFYRHRANIGRLLTGTERKTYLFKSNSEKLDLNNKK